MTGMARVSVALVLVLCVISAGCNRASDSDPLPSETAMASDSPTAGPDDFESEISTLCGRLLQADDAVTAADTEAEFEDAAAALADAQQRFVEEAERLTPPPEVEEPFSAFSMNSTRSSS